MNFKTYIISLILIGSTICHPMEHDDTPAALFGAVLSKDLAKIKNYEDYIAHNYNTILDDTQKDLLQAAILEGSDSIANWLIENMSAKIDFHHKDNARQTALTLAIELANAPVVKRILDNLSEEHFYQHENNATKSSLIRCFHTTSRMMGEKHQKNLSEIIKMLLEKRARITTDEVSTILTLALDNHNKDVSTLYVQLIRLVFKKIDIFYSAAEPFNLDSYVARIASAPGDRSDLLRALLTTAKHVKLTARAGTLSAIKAQEAQNNQCCALIMSLIDQKQNTLDANRQNTGKTALRPPPSPRTTALPSARQGTQEGNHQVTSSVGRHSAAMNQSALQHSTQQTLERKKAPAPSDMELALKIVHAAEQGDYVYLQKILTKYPTIPLMSIMPSAVDSFILNNNEKATQIHTTINLLLGQILNRTNSAQLLGEALNCVLTSSYDANSYHQKRNIILLTELILNHVTDFSNLQSIFHLIAALPGDLSQLIKVLLQKNKVSPILTDDQGRLPLLVALDNNNIHCAEELLSNWDVLLYSSSPDRRNRTALAIAISKSFTTIIALLSPTTNQNTVNAPVYYYLPQQQMPQTYDQLYTM